MSMDKILSGIRTFDGLLRARAALPATVARDGLGAITSSITHQTARCRRTTALRHDRHQELSRRRRLGPGSSRPLAAEHPCRCKSLAAESSPGTSDGSDRRTTDSSAQDVSCTTPSTEVRLGERREPSTKTLAKALAALRQVTAMTIVGAWNAGEPTTNGQRDDYATPATSTAACATSRPFPCACVLGPRDRPRVRSFPRRARLGNVDGPGVPRNAPDEREPRRSVLPCRLRD